MKQSVIRGLVLTVLHLAILCSLGAKLIYDRATRPRIWVKAAYYDPDLPIRGRYLSLQCTVKLENFKSEGIAPEYASTTAHLEIRDNTLIAVSDPDGSVDVWVRNLPSGERSAMISEATLVFVPEHAQLPELREHGKDIWIEATIPRKGPPRPIRLGVKQNEKIQPVEIR
jgi:hypothetical protein